MYLIDVTFVEEFATRTFQIEESEGHFAIKQNGEVIAVLENWETWEQTSGGQLDDDLFQKLVDTIEDYYE